VIVRAERARERELHAGERASDSGLYDSLPMRRPFYKGERGKEEKRGNILFYLCLLRNAVDGVGRFWNSADDSCWVD
jgi:hypothetical protein